MEIIVAFSKPKKFKIGAEFIKLVMNKNYSHVLIYWTSNNLDRSLVYHAANGSVHFLSKDNFEKENIIVKEIKLSVTELQSKKVVQKCIDLAGQCYSFMDLISVGLHDILRFFNINFYFKDYKGYICSELMVEILEEIFDKPFFKPKNLIKPSDIEDFIEKHKN